MLCNDFASTVVGSIDSIAHAELGALKEISSKNTRPSALDRMRVEVDVLTTQCHPSLLKCLDWDKKDKSWYVGAYHQAGPMSALDSSPWTANPRAAIAALLPAVSAVASLHEASICHRDLKPGNILVSDLGHLVVADPGIALVDEGDRLTGTRENVASYAWSPIWSRDGRADGKDFTHDVFSLVKILWAMIGNALSRQAENRLLHEFDWTHPRYDLRLQFAEQKSVIDLLSPLFGDALVGKQADAKIPSARVLESRLQDLYQRFTAPQFETAAESICNQVVHAFEA